MLYCPLTAPIYYLYVSVCSWWWCSISIILMTVWPHFFEYVKYGIIAWMLLFIRPCALIFRFLSMIFKLRICLVSFLWVRIYGVWFPLHYNNFYIEVDVFYLLPICQVYNIYLHTFFDHCYLSKTIFYSSYCSFVSRSAQAWSFVFIRLIQCCEPTVNQMFSDSFYCHIDNDRQTGRTAAKKLKTLNNLTEGDNWLHCCALYFCLLFSLYASFKWMQLSCKTLFMLIVRVRGAILAKLQLDIA